MFTARSASVRYVVVEPCTHPKQIALRFDLTNAPLS